MFQRNDRGRALAAVSHLAVAAGVCLAAASSAQAQFVPSGRGGYAQVEVNHGTLERNDPVGLTDWNWSRTVNANVSGLGYPCGGGFASIAMNSGYTAQGLRIAMSGVVNADGPISDCGSPGTSRAVDSWDFSVTQPTPFTMTVVLIDTFDTPPVQDGPAYLMIGSMQLTVGSMDAASGIFRSFPSAPLSRTDFFAGTLPPGGYTVRLSGLMSNLGAPSHGTFSQTLTIALGSRCATADFNNDGDIGTDADIEGFFACLGGNCCALCATADFNGDGDVGTDADIEAFFRVLAGGSC